MRNRYIINIIWVFYLIIFFFFTFYFSIIHPLIPFCTDDWININIARPFYPSLYSWNPTKVFPECLEPLVSMFAAFIIYPIIHDYVYAFIITNAVTVSFFISIYLYSLHRLIEKKYNIGNITCFGLVSIFTILHFLILKVNETNNDFLWHSTDCNCYYHYIIPTLLNASLVMWLMRHDINLKQMNSVSLSCLCFITYLSLFSNLYCSVILISYVGSCLFFKLLSIDKKQEKWFWVYIQQNSFYIAIIVCWLFIQLLEVNGLRANTYGHLNDPFVKMLVSTIRNFINIKYNHYFTFFAFGSFLLVTVVLLVKKKLISCIKKNKNIIASLLLTNTYLILLSSKVDTENVLKGYIVFSSVFFFLLIITLCLALLSKKLKRFAIIYPLLIFLLLGGINNRNSVFRGILYEYGYNEKAYIAYNKDIVKQVINADVLGESEVIINVPNFENPGHYPLSNDCSNFVGFTLYKHNILKNRIKTQFNTYLNNQ